MNDPLLERARDNMCNALFHASEVMLDANMDNWLQVDDLGHGALDMLVNEYPTNTGGSTINFVWIHQMRLRLDLDGGKCHGWE